MPGTSVKTIPGFLILQVSFLKEKADFLKKDIPFPTKEKKIKF